MVYRDHRPPDDTGLEEVRTLTHPRPIAATAWWRRRAEEGGGLPDRRRFDLPAEIKPWLPFVMLLDREDGATFRIRVYGTALAEAAGIDLTGKPMANMPAAFDPVTRTTLLVRTVETSMPVFGAGHYGWAGGQEHVRYETCYLPILKDDRQLQILGVRGFSSGPWR